MLRLEYPKVLHFYGSGLIENPLGSVFNITCTAAYFYELFFQMNNSKVGFKYSTILVFDWTN
jgi:hypothetical protein